MMTQSIALSKRPHIVVATPGRLMDHLENTKGFALRNLKYLVSGGGRGVLDAGKETESSKLYSFGFAFSFFFPLGDGRSRSITRS